MEGMAKFDNFQDKTNATKHTHDNKMLASQLNKMFLIAYKILLTTTRKKKSIIIEATKRKTSRFSLVDSIASPCARSKVEMWSESNQWMRPRHN